MIVGFSYDGMMTFKASRALPGPGGDHGSIQLILGMTRSDRDAIMQGFGFSSSSELLLPSSVKVFKTMHVDLLTALLSSRSAPSASPSSPPGTRSKSFCSVATASTLCASTSGSGRTRSARPAVRFQRSLVFFSSTAGPVHDLSAA
ncbi:hypothetical protein ACFX1R_000857 [Malus domestica]